MTSSTFEEASLQRILEKIAKNEKFEQPKFEVSLGSKPGDNFVGRIYRAVITETSKSNNGRRLSLIFKASPASKHRQTMLSTDDLFQLESDMYQVLLPTFNALLKKYGLSHSDVFPSTARCYMTEVNGPDSDDCHALVLEDKMVDGFQMFSGPDKTLDAEHCRFVLKRLALWHATSMALNHHEPETAQKLKKLLHKEKLFMFNENHPLWDELVVGAKGNINRIKETCEVNEASFKKIDKLMENYKSLQIELNQECPDLFCILQGDCWTNNILLKYAKDGSIEDICLVDLQIGRVASPAVEITYLLHLCTTKEMRAEHYHNLIKFYHDELTSNLRKLGCNPEEMVPWEKLQDHLLRFGKIAALNALTALPVMAADPSDINVDLHASHHEGHIFVESANVTNQKRNEAILRRTADVVEDCDRWGYL